MRYHLLLVLAVVCSLASCIPQSKRVDKGSSKAETSQVSEKKELFKADAQLNLKSSYEVGEPIRVGCTCNPIDGVKLTTEWSYSSGIKALDFDDLTKDLWAKPGTNKVSVKLKMLKTHKLTVFVQDPAFPGDPTKAKLQEIEVFDNYSESVLEGEFVQKGAVEPPPVVKVAVPNVVGMDYSAAYNALNVVGLDVNLNGPGTGIVEKQIPTAGSIVILGSTVQVFVPSTPKPPDPPPSPQTSGPLRVMILREADDQRDNKYPAQVTASYENLDIFTYLGSHGAKPGFTSPVVWDDDYSAGQLTAAGYTTDVEQAYQTAKSASGANTSNAKEPWLTIQQADKSGAWQTVYSGQITTDNAKDVFPTVKKFGGP